MGVCVEGRLGLVRLAILWPPHVRNSLHLRYLEELARECLPRGLFPLGGVPVGVNATKTLARSAPRDRARRVGVDSSTKRSWCVSHRPLSTSASRRDVEAAPSAYL